MVSRLDSVKVKGIKRVWKYHQPRDAVKMMSLVVG